MAKTTKKTTTAQKTNRRKSTTAKESPRSTKKTTPKAAAKNASKTTGRSTSKKRAATATSKKVASKKTSAGETEVVMDRRRGERRSDSKPAGAECRKIERREKVTRRRQIDPTTCERDYSDDEVEFMNALDDYKRSSGRMFPTCSEILEVIRKLGYAKQSTAEASPSQEPETSETQAAATVSPVVTVSAIDGSTAENLLVSNDALV